MADFPPDDVYKLPRAELKAAIKEFLANAYADFEQAGALGYLDSASEEEKTIFYSTRASARLLHKQYAATTSDLTQMIRRGEANAECYFKRSFCYQQAGLYHLAASDLLQILLRRYPTEYEPYYEPEANDVRAYRKLAKLYADDLRDDAKALEAYDALLRLSPKDDDARLRRALLLDRMGEGTKAAEDFRLLQKDAKAKLLERIPEKYRLPLEAAQEEEAQKQ